jgi:hypothetical protein
MVLGGGFIAAEPGDPHRWAGPYAKAAGWSGQDAGHDRREDADQESTAAEVVTLIAAEMARIGARPGCRTRHAQGGAHRY